MNDDTRPIVLPELHPAAELNAIRDGLDQLYLEVKELADQISNR
jgi:hypothetical protein